MFQEITKPIRTELLHELLLRHRLAKGLPVAHVARTAGMTPQGYRNLESGASRPSLDSLATLCATLGIDDERALCTWIRSCKNPQLSSAMQSAIDTVARQNINANGGPDSATIRRSLDNRREISDHLSHIPLDDASILLFKDLVDRIVGYRRALTSDPNPAKNRRISPPYAKVPFRTFPDKSMISNYPVAASRDGIGHLATFIKVAKGCGGFHRHVRNRYLDAGTEFFVVLHGSGQLFVERSVRGSSHSSRKRADKAWDAFPLVPGVAGFYRGDCGHAHVAGSAEDLIVFLVCVPFPPQLSDPGTEESDSNKGYAEGVEFRLNELQRAVLPESLRDAILATMPFG